MDAWTFDIGRDSPGGPDLGLAGDEAARLAWLTRALDEIDYGMVLADATGLVRFANRLGQRQLVGGGPVQSVHGRLRGMSADDQARLSLALADVQRGRRSLLCAGHAAAALSVAVIPMACDEDTGERLALLVFGKQPRSDTLTIDFYGRSHGLTAAETAVLKCLCAGLGPKEVAQQQRVALCTVRSHIGSIRMKTQTGSLRDLLNRVAALPPITVALQCATATVAHVAH